MDEAAILETSSLYSIAGLLSEEQPIVSRRPFRTVYHTASPLSLSGGGNLGRPGEMALAHHGILFLDELLEFDRKAIEILREPLESKEVRFSRVSGTYKYPADFSLIATTNPCPCGFLGDNEKECRCSPAEIERYSHKLS